MTMPRSFPTAVLFSLAMVFGCGRSEMETLAGGTEIGASGAAGGLAGATFAPCGEVTCLASLFGTCVPEGDCHRHSGSSPSASFDSTCYANGISVSRSGGAALDGKGTASSFSVRRRDKGVCYSIDGSAPMGVSGFSYVITDSAGRQVATAVAAGKAPPMVEVTCAGGKPVLVSADCLDPIDTNVSCSLSACP